MGRAAGPRRKGGLLFHDSQDQLESSESEQVGNDAQKSPRPGVQAGVGHGVEPLEEVKGLLGKGLEDTVSWKLGKGIMKRTPLEQEGIRSKAPVWAGSRPLPQGEQPSN